MPILTKKTLFLILVALTVEILVLLVSFSRLPDLLWLPVLLVVFDVFTPLIVSKIVLLLQPFTVLARNRIIAKARAKRKSFKNLLVIGITGSYGKTSTKEFLYSILSSKSKVLKTEKHQNSEVGISQCILNDLKPEHEIFICEMGAYNVGGIRLLCSIAEPKMGVLTGINEQHMATFGSQDNIIKAKYELIESLSQDGVAFFNAKNKYCLGMYGKTKVKKYLYGEDAAVFGGENIFGAKAVAKELGMTDSEIETACLKIENKFPGIEIKKGAGGITVIDATYSANPDGVIANLEYLKTFSGRKVIVMPCLIELGKASKEVHERIGKKIAEVCDTAIITTKDRFLEIKKAAGDKAVFIENPKEIFEKLERVCAEGDTVLLESRVSKKLISLLAN
jgi:UDP-N-acetylmuramoyl-tripeptide--D-alanyl-D-alanine ligase